MSGLIHVLIVLALAISPGVGVKISASNSTCGDQYVVQTGDTLAKIAKRCETTLREIIDNNPHLRNPDLIYTGTVLDMSQSKETDLEDDLSEEPVSTLSETTGEVYIVQLGDTLAKIAKRHGRSTRDLILANPHIKNPAVIYVGDQVTIPSQYLVDQAIEQRQAEIVRQVDHNGERWIDVDLAAQTVRAYEGNELIREFLASTGRAATPTVTGQFRVWIKFLADDMRGPGYFLEDVPYVMYFYKGYGLHGTYWHNNFGTPMSHGCVNLSIEDSAWLYDFANVGTLVNVH